MIKVFLNRYQSPRSSYERYQNHGQGVSVIAEGYKDYYIILFGTYNLPNLKWIYVDKCPYIVTRVEHFTYYNYKMGSLFLTKMDVIKDLDIYLDSSLLQITNNMLITKLIARWNLYREHQEILET